jgi:hypothetical protein
MWKNTALTQLRYCFEARALLSDEEKATIERLFSNDIQEEGRGSGLNKQGSQIAKIRFISCGEINPAF